MFPHGAFRMMHFFFVFRNRSLLITVNDKTIIEINLKNVGWMTKKLNKFVPTFKSRCQK